MFIILFLSVRIIWELLHVVLALFLLQIYTTLSDITMPLLIRKGICCKRKTRQKKQQKNKTKKSCTENSSYLRVFVAFSQSCSFGWVISGIKHRNCCRLVWYWDQVVIRHLSRHSQGNCKNWNYIFIFSKTLTKDTLRSYGVPFAGWNVVLGHVLTASDRNTLCFQFNASLRNVE